jgi:hypothetical protein
MNAMRKIQESLIIHTITTTGFGAGEAKRKKTLVRGGRYDNLLQPSPTPHTRITLFSPPSYPSLSLFLNRIYVFVSLLRVNYALSPSLTVSEEGRHRVFRRKQKKLGRGKLPIPLPFGFTPLLPRLLTDSTAAFTAFPGVVVGCLFSFRVDCMQKMSSSHIHLLPSADAAALSACAEFPTFSDTLAAVMQVALPALEKEVWEASTSASRSCTPQSRRRVKSGSSRSSSYNTHTPPLHSSVVFESSSLLESLPSVVENADGSVPTCNHCPCASVDVSVSVPTFAFDVERRVVWRNCSDIFSGVCQRRLDHVAAASLALFSRLASICLDVGVSVQVSALQLPRDESQAVKSGVPCREKCTCHHPLQAFLLSKRWHRGQETATVTDEQTTTHHACLHAGQFEQQSSSAVGSGALLITRCCVRGLFDNMPLRQAALKVGHANVPSKPVPSPLSSPSTFSWAVRSASAQRARHEEQTHLFTVLFQTAVCTVLAPLYLHPNAGVTDRCSALGRADPVLVAHLYTGDTKRAEATDSIPSGRTTPHKGSPCCRAIVSLAKTHRAASAVCGALTDDNLPTRPDQRGTLSGFACDRNGIRSGCLVVQQAAPTRPTGTLPLPPDTTLYPTTRGEATAQQLCGAFNIDFSSLYATVAVPASTVASSAPQGTMSNACRRVTSRFTEVVVDTGVFAVLFYTASPSGVATGTDAATATRVSSASAASVRSYFSSCVGTADAPAPSRALPETCLIVIADQQPLHAKTMAGSGSPPLPSFRILEPGHWAYDVVAAQTQSFRRRSTSPLSAFPVFIFADAAYVPAHLCESRQRQRRADKVGQTHNCNLSVSFAHLYGEAVALLHSSHPPAASEIVSESRWMPCVSPSPQPSAHPSPLRNRDAERGKEGALNSSAAALAVGCNEPSKDDGLHSAAAPTTTAGSTPDQSTSEVDLRMQYVFSRVLEAAAAPGTQCLLPSLDKTSVPSSDDGVSHKIMAASVPLPPLHRVRLSPMTLWMNATERNVGCTADPIALPRRTPVSLHPKLQEIIREEKEEEKEMRAQTKRRAAVAGNHENADLGECGGAPEKTAADEDMTRMRQLLDTGRGSVLRQLPRACNAPLSWTPANKAKNRVQSPVAAPPIGSAQLKDLTVLPWARKFILLVCPLRLSSNMSLIGKRRREEELEVQASPLFSLHPSAVSQTPLPCPSRPHPHQLQWWVLDQHAVHERVRLEFFLCFADTYVLHPELLQLKSVTTTAAHRPSAIMANQQCGDGAARAISVLSCHAQQALERRQRHFCLLQALAQNNKGSVAFGCYHEPFLSPSALHPPFADVPQSFPAVIPMEWRVRVSLVEPHLLQWGWRFQHEWNPTGTDDALSLSHRYTLPTAVLSWPRLSVEDVEHHVTSLQALTETVEELEALGGASAATAAPAASPLLAVPSVFLRFFVSRSCRGAVMFGDAVTPAAARHLVAALECVEQYYLCSHGRHSMASLTPFNEQ